MSAMRNGRPMEHVSRSSRTAAITHGSEFSPEIRAQSRGYRRRRRAMGPPSGLPTEDKLFLCEAPEAAELLIRFSFHEIRRGRCGSLMHQPARRISCINRQRHCVARVLELKAERICTGQPTIELFFSRRWMGGLIFIQSARPAGSRCFSLRAITWRSTSRSAATENGCCSRATWGRTKATSTAGTSCALLSTRHNLKY